MRVVSLTFREAATAQQGDKVPVTLVTITHPDMSEPLRISSDPTVELSTDPRLFGTRSRGQTFWHIPMALVLPDSQPQAAPKGQLVVSNIAVDRDFAGVEGLQYARVSDLALMSPSMATVLLELTLSTSPDVIERRWPKLKSVTAEIDGATVALTFGRDNRTREPFPALTFNQHYFPGLY